MPSIIDDLGTAAFNFALTALVVALFTMLFLQAVYGLGVRPAFQRWMVRSWLRRRLEGLAAPPSAPAPAAAAAGTRSATEPADPVAARVDAAPPSLLPVPTLEEVEGELVNVAGAGRRSALYSLSHAQLCGQIAAAVQAELDAPGPRPLTRVFAAGARNEDLAAVDAGSRRGTAGSSAGGEGVRPTVPPLVSTVEGKEKEGAKDEDAPFRVRFHAERGIDDLQSHLARAMQFGDYAFSLLVTLSLLAVLSTASVGDVQVDDSRPVGDDKFWVYLSVALAASLLVPVIRMLVDRATVARQV
jgi:hypothetical protein